MYREWGSPHDRRSRYGRREERFDAPAPPTVVTGVENWSLAMDLRVVVLTPHRFVRDHQAN